MAVDPNGVAIDRLAALVLGPWKRRAALLLHLVELCFGASTAPAPPPALSHGHAPLTQDSVAQ